MTMSLFDTDDTQRRALAKQALETLEFWLRRLIHDELTKDYGPSYLNAKTPTGDNLIKNEIQKKIGNRLNAEPKRYQRPIDASLLEHQIDIICNPNLFKKHFSTPLKKSFPDGREEARTFLKRLEEPRNLLAHANSISVRQFEQVICYTNDIIESLKEHYIAMNQASEFNVPRFIKAIDHFGNVLHLTEKGNYEFHNDSKSYLWPGDTLIIEIEVDPSFDPKDYEILWYGTHFSTNDRKLVLKIEEKHVSETFSITCRTITNKGWHRYQTFDDQFHCSYKVLPPK